MYNYDLDGSVAEFCVSCCGRNAIEAREREENAFQYMAYFFLVIRNKVTTSTLLVKTILNWTSILTETEGAFSSEFWGL